MFWVKAGGFEIAVTSQRLATEGDKPGGGRGYPSAGAAKKLNLKGLMKFSRF